MIRPFTLVCFVLACGSGLYLYQSKHRVQVLDREIEKTVHATDALREQTRVLHAEWTLLNDPQRLQSLADQFLELKTVTPGQFTSMAELDARLPPVRAPEPPPTEQPPIPAAQAPEAVQVEESKPVAVPAPPPPAPAAAKPAPVVATTAPPPAPKPPEQPRPPERKPPVVAEAPPPRAAPPRPVAAVEPSRPSPSVAPVVLPTQAVPVVSGSALGMAHSAPPPPRPVPVNASQWVTNGGGG